MLYTSAFGYQTGQFIRLHSNSFCWAYTNLKKKILKIMLLCFQIFVRNHDRTPITLDTRQITVVREQFLENRDESVVTEEAFELNENGDLDLTLDTLVNETKSFLKVYLFFFFEKLLNSLIWNYLQAIYQDQEVILGQFETTDTEDWIEVDVLNDRYYEHLTDQILK